MQSTTGITFTRSLLAAATLAVAAPAAFAQFTVTDQRGSLTVNVKEPLGLPAENKSAYVTAGDLSSQNLSVVASLTDETFDIQGHASLTTMASGSVVGLSDEIGLSFKRLNTVDPQNYTVYGGVTVRARLTFTVDQSTDVSIAANYPNDLLYIGTHTLYQNSISLGKVTGYIAGAVDSFGAPAYLTTSVTQNNGLAHLEVGTYVLNVLSVFQPPSSTSGPTIVFLPGGGISSGYGTLVTPPSLGTTSASIVITAVPEAGTFWMLGVGLMGLAAVRRRGQAAAGKRIN